MLKKENTTDNTLFPDEIESAKLLNFKIVKMLGTGTYGKVALCNKNNEVDTCYYTDRNYHCVVGNKTNSVSTVNNTCTNTNTPLYISNDTNTPLYISNDTNTPLSSTSDTNTLYYALKFIRKDTKELKVHFDRIKSEVQLHSLLNHSNIVKLYYAVQTKYHIVLVMEYVKGKELFYHIQQNIKLSEEQTRYIFNQILDALEYLHSHHIIHRDIKPENIIIGYGNSNKGVLEKDKGYNPLLRNSTDDNTLLDINTVDGTPLRNSTDDNTLLYNSTDDNTSINTSSNTNTPLTTLSVKIIDMGFATLYDPNTTIKNYCGSPYYSPPEMINGSRYIGPEIDIWSMGVLLYNMVEGKLPFDAKSLNTLYSKINRGSFKISNNISSSLKDLLKCMLCVDINKRITLKGIKRHVWTKGVCLNYDFDRICYVDPLIFSKVVEYFSVCGRFLYKKGRVNNSERIVEKIKIKGVGYKDRLEGVSEKVCELKGVSEKVCELEGVIDKYSNYEGVNNNSVLEDVNNSDDCVCYSGTCWDNTLYDLNKPIQLSNGTVNILFNKLYRNNSTETRIYTLLQNKLVSGVPLREVGIIRNVCFNSRMCCPILCSEREFMKKDSINFYAEKKSFIGECINSLINNRGVNDCTVNNGYKFTGMNNSIIYDGGVIYNNGKGKEHINDILIDMKKNKPMCSLGWVFDKIKGFFTRKKAKKQIHHKTTLTCTNIKEIIYELVKNYEYKISGNNKVLSVLINEPEYVLIDIIVNGDFRVFKVEILYVNGCRDTFDYFCFRLMKEIRDMENGRIVGEKYRSATF